MTLSVGYTKVPISQILWVENIALDILEKVLSSLCDLCTCTKNVHQLVYYLLKLLELRTLFFYEKKTIVIEAKWSFGIMLLLFSLNFVLHFYLWKKLLDYCYNELDINSLDC